jgi:hypothetical protein
LRRIASLADVEICCRYAPLKDVLALIFDATTAAKTDLSAVVSAALRKSPLFEHTPCSNGM